jgi:large subunit ribosomal protein L5
MNKDANGSAQPRLLKRYRETSIPELSGRFGHRNPLAVPRMVKIVINMGVGRALREEKALPAAVEELGLITGQRPAVTKARQSVAGFRLRQGNAIGCRVTLRGRRMYEFMDRLISIGIPRIRDFRGLSPKGMDRKGNFTMGIGEQLIFPEVPADKVHHVQGMDVTFVTTARSDEQGLALLESLGMPFRKKGDEALR